MSTLPRTTDRTVLFPLLAVLALAPAACQAPPEADSTATVSSGDDGGAAMMANLLEQTGIAKGKILRLAEALPEDAYAWRPMEGVRSASEVFVHIAADNYFIPVIMGVESPAETGITMDYSTVQAYEAREVSKDEVLAMLAASFAHLEQAAAQTQGDLGAELSFGSNTFSMGGLWTQAVTHLHEHLGQSVAYARANGTTPPWSM